MPIKERHWNSLVTSLRHGQCVLVLGSDIPCLLAPDRETTEGPEPPLTVSSALALRLREELEGDGKAVSGGTLAVVAQSYEDAEGFGANALRSTAARHLTELSQAAPRAYESIAALPFPLIVATGQDRMFERALEAAGKEPILGRYHFRGDRHDNPELTSPGSIGSPVLYHLFGDAGEPQSLVLSENDLLDFLIAVVAEKPPLPNSFRTAMKRAGQSFLFLGFGVTNWYLRVLLKVIVRSLELNRSGSTMALERLQGLSDTDRQQTLLFYQRGTRVELYDEDLQAFTGELLARVQAEGGIVESRAAAGPRPRIFVSYASEDGGLAARLFSALQRAQFDPWLDRDALQPGEDWNASIEEHLREAHYVLVLETPALADKYDSYVNKEISLARDRALKVRGSFLIPLRCEGMGERERVPSLTQYQDLPLRSASFDDDFNALNSHIRRDFQRRQR